MAETQGIIEGGTKFKLQKPPKYKVIMHNDDTTTMDFVIMVLVSIFMMDESDAELTMLRIHNEGKAIVGTYSKDIAESKRFKTERMARANNYPLQLSVEKD